MKKMYNLLLIALLSNSLFCSWKEQVVQSYSSYIAPAFQSSYDYFKNINPSVWQDQTSNLWQSSYSNYLQNLNRNQILGATLFSIATLGTIAYLRSKSKNRFFGSEAAQELAKNILQSNHAYFTKKSDQSATATVWNNVLIEAASKSLSSESTEHPKVGEMAYRLSTQKPRDAGNIYLYLSGLNPEKRLKAALWDAEEDVWTLKEY